MRRYWIRDRPTSVDPFAVLRQNVAECRRLWQRTKKERPFVQHTCTPGDTSRRFYALVATKFQVSVIISLGGQATYGKNRSQELADEMDDGWCPLMTHFFDLPDTAAFLERATPRAALMILM